MTETILEIDNLTTAFETEAGEVRAIEGVSFTLEKGKTLGVVGESGCGKSVTSLSIMRLLPIPSGKVLSGEIRLQDQDLLQIPIEAMRKIRGNRISMIFQEPMTALNPVHNIGKQLGELFKIHQPELTQKNITEQCVDLLDKVKIPAPRQRLKEYPHQLSGGMRQRVMIAMALACKPDILIADEPTTALDVTIQAQILNLMRQLQKEMSMSIIFITHDLGVIAEMCDDVVVMYAGKIVEKATVNELFQNPQHPYTRGLLAAIPKLDTPGKELLKTIPGSVPDLYSLPKGCRFQNRCSYQNDKCVHEQPRLEATKIGHQVSCFHWRKQES